MKKPTIPAPELTTPPSKAARPLRVALYTRVSTEDQAKEGFSLDVQMERLRSYAKAHQWKAVGEYVDEGHSGRKIRRPQYQAMMHAIETWDIILVLKMDRIHRSSRNFMEMMDQLRLRGKEFASVMENLDTSTAMGRFVMDIIQRIAQLESDQTGERVHMVMHYKARTQIGAIGPAPFGVRIHTGTYAANQRELRVAAMIFDRCLAGYSLTDIALALNNKRLRPRFATAWSECTVRDVLRDVTLIGIRVWGRYILAGHHKPLLDVDVFVRAQKILDARGVILSSFRKGPDFAAKRAEAIRATQDGRTYHAEFQPSQTR